MASLRLTMKDYSLLRDTFVTTALSVVGKGIAFVVPIFIGRMYGATESTDSFFFAFALVSFLIGVLGNVVETSVIPFITEMRIKEQKRGKEDGYGGAVEDSRPMEEEGRFIGQMLVASALITIPLSLLLLLVGKPLLGFVTGLSNVDLTYRLMVEISPLLTLVILSSILNGALNACKVFWFPALSPAIRAVGILAGLWALHGPGGIHALTLSYVAAELLRTVISAMVLTGYAKVRIQLSFPFDSRMRELARSAGAFTALMALLCLPSVVDRLFVSLLPSGTVTILEYARTLFFIPVTALYSGFMVVSLVARSERFHGSQGGQDQKRVLLYAIKPLALICVLCGVVGIPLSPFIVKLIYGPALTESQVVLTGRTLAWLLVSLPPYMVSSYLLQSSMIHRRIAPLLKWSAGSVLLLVLLDWAAVRSMGAPGIGLANFFAYGALAVAVYRNLAGVSRQSMEGGGAPCQKGAKR